MYLGSSHGVKGHVLYVLYYLYPVPCISPVYRATFWPSGLTRMFALRLVDLAWQAEEYAEDVLGTSGFEPRWLL